MEMGMEVNAKLKAQNMANSENCEKEVERSTPEAKSGRIPLENASKAVQRDEDKTKFEISKSELKSSTASSKQAEVQEAGNNVKEFGVNSPEITTADEICCAEAGTVMTRSLSVTTTARGATAPVKSSGSPGEYH
uniref:Uncharacterized protein n=1 Tax=Picea sitchensis TaxID=3332 RepID=A9NYD7_PICSI|nr:unknown [Picea sitchensis]